MTLDELKNATGWRECAPVPATPVAVHPMALPWWVVLLSGKPGPNGNPRFKFDFGYATREEAEARCKQRQEAENHRAAELNARKLQDAENRGADVDEVVPYQPIQFFVIERPKGGVL